MTTDQWTSTWVGDAIGAIMALDWYLTLHHVTGLDDPDIGNELTLDGRHGPTVFSTSGGTASLNETVTWAAVSDDVTHVGISDTATAGAGVIRGWVAKTVTSGADAVLTPGAVQFNVAPEVSP